MAKATKAAKPAPQDSLGGKPLSPRETEVSKLLAVGQTNREIAEALDISIKTIDTHRGHIMAKLRLRNNVELARHALREGWVQL